MPSVVGSKTSLVVADVRVHVRLEPLDHHRLQQDAFLPS